MSNPIADGNTSMPHIDGNQKEKEVNNEVTVQTEHGKPDMPDVDRNQKEKEVNNEVTVRTEHGKPDMTDVDQNQTEKEINNEVTVQTENGKPDMPDVERNQKEKEINNEMTVQTEHGKPDMPDVDRNQTEKEINNEVTVMKNSISHNTSDNKQGGTDGHNKNDDTGVTATNTPLDQDPNLSQPQPSPDQTKQMAVSAKSGQSKVNSLTGKKKDDAGQQKGKGGNAGTSKSDNNEYYAKLEERLQQLSQRCTSMEETIQNHQNRKNVAYIWIFSSVCIVVIAYAVPSFFFNKEGTASPVSDSRLEAIEEQLRLIKGSLPVNNSQHFQTLQADLVRIEGEFSSKHNVGKQELRDSIEMTTTRFENIKKEVDGFDRAVKEIDKKIDKIVTDIEISFQDKKEIDKKIDKIGTDIEISFQDKIDDVKRHIKTFENLPERVQNLKNQIGHVEDDVRSTRTFAEDILAATNEKLEKREKQIIQLNETLESLDHELNITTGKLNRTKEIQDIIHKNTFDKGSLIIVMLIIIIGLAALGFYVCVYKPWQPRNFSQANVSEAQQALSAVPNRPVLGSTVCIISFKLNRSAEYQALVRSALSTSGFADIMHEITKHTDIPRLPHCKMYIMCVEFSERHVIIEEPGIGLGDMKRTTYEAVSKLGGVLVILYVNHRGSRRIQDLYSTEIYCINRQPQLKTLETHNRFISTYDQLNDRQKDALKQALREALN
ncbi:putative leucine-rich repeat-containing protein DDB_G0290503 isoform X7 [Dreissena polymorpha]|uniref:putative leucine-rich repeat-containing protein DDB_G0290503 isoform X7 n=1 Tax=Dreissena polymorpha TaxID=45954 RepID=UPI0022647CE5|nr:putative leucine-rich repeat-containing protein DDB_G0290503 isoform X7 [Dreissena polymorpha]